MRLILARHGNTFAPGETPVWIGKNEDLPLVPSGFDQAEGAANALIQAGIVLSAIYHAPLKRTTQFAEVVAKAQTNSTPLYTDERLMELDYGKWSGLSEEQIVSQFGSEELQGWSMRGEWPHKAAWPGSFEDRRAEAASFIDDLSKKHGADENVLVVSSNGRLRFFLSLDLISYGNHRSKQDLKTKTGNFSIGRVEGGVFKLERWNFTPSEL